MRAILIFIFSSVAGLLNAQHGTEILKIQEATVLKDGVYISIEDFKSNKPRSAEEISRILEKMKKENPEVERPQLHIWGYASGGSAYVSWVSGWEYLSPEQRRGYNFNRIMSVGAVCQFSYHAPEYQNKGLAQDTDPYLKQLPRNIRRTSVKATQYIIDLSTNSILLLNTRNIQEIIMRDEKLAKEWGEYKGSHKEKKYFFLKRYNELHTWDFNQKTFITPSVNN